MQTAIEECSTESKASPKTKQKITKTESEQKKSERTSIYIFESSNDSVERTAGLVGPDSFTGPVNPEKRDPSKLINCMYRRRRRRNCRQRRKRFVSLGRERGRKKEKKPKPQNKLQAPSPQKSSIPLRKINK